MPKIENTRLKRTFARPGASSSFDVGMYSAYLENISTITKIASYTGLPFLHGGKPVMKSRLAYSKGSLGTGSGSNKP